MAILNRKNSFQLQKLKSDFGDCSWIFFFLEMWNSFGEFQKSGALVETWNLVELKSTMRFLHANEQLSISPESFVPKIDISRVLGSTLY